MDSAVSGGSSERFILPMSGNIIVVVLILQITTIWNDFLIGITFGGIGTHP